MSKQTDKRTHLIASTDEAWDNGQLGRSEDHVKVSDDIAEELINEALDLQSITRSEIQAKQNKLQEKKSQFKSDKQKGSRLTTHRFKL